MTHPVRHECPQVEQGILLTVVFPAPLECFKVALYVRQVVQGISVTDFRVTILQPDFGDDVIPPETRESGFEGCPGCGIVLSRWVRKVPLIERRSNLVPDPRKAIQMPLKCQPALHPVRWRVCQEQEEGLDRGVGFHGGLKFQRQVRALPGGG